MIAVPAILAAFVGFAGVKLWKLRDRVSAVVCFAAAVSGAALQLV